MTSRSEPFKSDSAFVHFTLLGFHGDDIIKFTENCNSKWDGSFEFRTVTPANINVYNKTSGSFFATIAVKQIGDTPFEQSDFPIGRSIYTANPNFACLAAGCSHSRMTLKHNGIGDDRGHNICRSETTLWAMTTAPPRSST